MTRHEQTDHMSSDPDPAVRVFTREQLHELIWSRPVAAVAAELGKSGPVLYGFCRRNDVPTPPQGWWTKAKHGVAQVPTPLPPRDDAAPIVIATGPGRPSPEAKTAAKVARAVARPGPYPGYPHPVVTKLIASFRRSRRNYEGFLHRPRWTTPWLMIGCRSLGRLETILGTLASKLEPIGGEFAPSQKGIVIGIDNRFVMLKVIEGRRLIPYRPTAKDKLRVSRWMENPRRSPDDKPRIPIRGHVPDGRLRIELQPVGARGLPLDIDGSTPRNFGDEDARRLEDMLDEVAAAIVALTADMSPDPVPDRAW